MVHYMILYSAFPHPFKSCKFLARQAIHFRRGLFLSSTKMFRAATLANYAYVSKDVISKCCILHPPNYTRILKRPKLKIPFLKKSSRPFYLLEKQEEFCASHFRQYFFFGNKDFFFREIRVFHLAETDFMLAPSAHISEDFSNTAATPFDLRSNETLINGPFIG